MIEEDDELDDIVTSMRETTWCHDLEDLKNLCFHPEKKAQYGYRYMSLGVEVDIRIA